MAFCSKTEFFERNVNFENSNFGIDLNGSKPPFPVKSLLLPVAKEVQNYKFKLDIAAGPCGGPK